MDAEDNTPAPPPESVQGNAASLQNAPQNRRLHPRYAVDENCVLIVVNHGLSLQCRIIELSLNGCRLCSLDSFPLPAGLRVEVTFKVHGVAFRFLGAVQWTDNQHLVGIRFYDAISRRSEQLAHVISEIEVAVRESAAKQAASKTSAEKVANQQASDRTEVEARHCAAIQKAARDARAVPEAMTPVFGLQQPSTRERRAHERLRVNTVATIILVKTGLRLKGRIVDLSLTGCRIRGLQPLSLAIYTRIETEFRFGGLPFLLGGVIQNVHDSLTVGIRFLDVSNRKREQLEQLVAELAEDAKGSERPSIPGEAQIESHG